MEKYAKHLLVASGAFGAVLALGVLFHGYMVYKTVSELEQLKTRFEPVETNVNAIVNFLNSQAQ